MALTGTGSGFLDAADFEMGRLVTVIVAPTGSYPAAGEPLNDILVNAVMKGMVKIVSGITPINVLAINDDLGHLWTYDRANNKLRNWTAISATPTEHSTGAYIGNEASSKIAITILIDKAASMTKVIF
jgi:hypothetical protein